MVIHPVVRSNRNLKEKKKYLPRRGIIISYAYKRLFNVFVLCQHQRHMATRKILEKEERKKLEAKNNRSEDGVDIP